MEKDTGGRQVQKQRRPPKKHGAGTNLRATAKSRRDAGATNSTASANSRSGWHRGKLGRSKQRSYRLLLECDADRQSGEWRSQGWLRVGVRCGWRIGRRGGGIGLLLGRGGVLGGRLVGRFRLSLLTSATAGRRGCVARGGNFLARLSGESRHSLLRRMLLLL